MIGGAVALVLAVLFYLVLSNSHIMIFPGNTFVFDYNSGYHSKSGMELISLLAHSRGYNPDNDYEKLNILGYIVSFLVVFCIPAGIGYFASKKLTK